MLHDVMVVINAMLFVIGIIAGIGPQTLNIISHGIQKNYAVTITVTCVLADAILIVFGCVGLSYFEEATILIRVINAVGAIFLSWYLINKIKGLFLPHHVRISKHKDTTFIQAITKALAITWLNPLVFIDTIVLIGGTSATYHGNQKWLYLTGALLGDFVWLFSLMLAGIIFSNKLNKPKVWITLDIFTIIIVLYVMIHMFTRHFEGLVNLLQHFAGTSL